MSIYTKIEEYVAEKSLINFPLFVMEFNENLDQRMLENTLSAIKHTLKDHKLPLKTRKRCYGIIVEALENSMRHKHSAKRHAKVFHRFCMDNSMIEMCFGNYVSDEDLPRLKQYLEFAKNGTKRKIKNAMYRTAADGKPLSDKGGAGVGIYDMVIKSEGNFNYDFFLVNSSNYFITLIRIEYEKPPM